MTGVVVIIGAGGHTRVLAEAVAEVGGAVRAFASLDGGGFGAGPGGPPVMAEAGLDPTDSVRLVNGVGGGGAAGALAARRRVQERLQALGFVFTGVRHPRAWVADSAVLAPDVQLMAGCMIQSGAVLGSGVIVNTAAVVEHGCRIGAWSHCAPGSILCGDVELGEGVHVGAGAVVLQGVRLPPWTVVGAGAVVVRAMEGEGPLIGVPARRKGTA